MGAGEGGDVGVASGVGSTIFEESAPESAVEEDDGEGDWAEGEGANKIDDPENSAACRRRRTPSCSLRRPRPCPCAWTIERSNNPRMTNPESRLIFIAFRLGRDCVVE